ncbi:carboxylesterase family protein, partial [Corallococcus exiguus]|nr:carboxylesterase family protein [Corallococcus exiguus]
PTQDVLSDEDRAYSRQVSNWMLQFARTGAPASATEWPKHQPGEDRTLRMQQPPKVEHNFMQLRLNAFLLASAIINSADSRSGGKHDTRGNVRHTGASPQKKNRPEGTT